MKIGELLLLGLVIFIATLLALLVWAMVIKKQIAQSTSGGWGSILGGLLGTSSSS